MQIIHRKKHFPLQLSGGQQQRVAVARAVIANPSLILADEPTGALDSVTGNDVLEILHDLWKNEGKTIIMITHDLKLAKFASKIVELKDGEIISIRENKNKNQIKLSK